LKQTLKNIEARYRGEVGRRWRRIGIGRPQGYWEENAVAGRQRATERILAWMEPLEGRRILDAGCGGGDLARRMADAGAAVTAIDLVAPPPGPELDRADAGNPLFLTGDFQQFLKSGQADGVDTIVLSHVLEDYTADEHRDLLRATGDSGALRVYLIFLIPGTGSQLLGPLLPEGLGDAVDPIPLLRWVHLNTPFRQTRQDRVGIRNYRAQVTELIRS
jgi:SAM-dependent methyltransferase